MRGNGASCHYSMLEKNIWYFSDDGQASQQKEKVREILSVALVDEKEIGRVETTDVEIEIPIVVHIREGCTHAPAPCGAHARAVAHIAEPPLAEVSIEPAAAVVVGHEEIGKPVAIEVAGADPAARSLFLHQGERRAPGKFIHEIDA